MTSHGVGWKMMVNFFDMTSDCYGHLSWPVKYKFIWSVNLIKSCNLIGWIWDNQINASQYLLLAINIWDDWVMNSARLLADSPFSSLGAGRISMFKGCGMFLIQSCVIGQHSSTRSLFSWLPPVSGHSCETGLAREAKTNACQLQLDHLRLAKIKLSF